jgi:hypothetical protein
MFNFVVQFSHGIPGPRIGPAKPPGTSPAIGPIWKASKGRLRRVSNVGPIGPAWEKPMAVFLGQEFPRISLGPFPLTPFLVVIPSHIPLFSRDHSLGFFRV